MYICQKYFKMGKKQKLGCKADSCPDFGKKSNLSARMGVSKKKKKDNYEWVDVEEEKTGWQNVRDLDKDPGEVMPSRTQNESYTGSQETAARKAEKDFSGKKKIKVRKKKMF